MGINTLATAIIFQQQLDLVAQQEAVTGYMELNASQVKYTGGAEVKIPKMSLQGLADYNRDTGYVDGAITLSYQTKTLTQDRGRRFSLDAIDVDETNFVATAAAVMGEFQRKYVVPEMDAYRLSAIATTAITAGNVKYGYTVGESTILKEIKTGIKKITAKGYKNVVVHITPDAMLELEMAMAGKLTTVTFSQGGINTTVPGIDGCALIETAEDRMYSAIKINATGAGGYEKATTGKQCNFIVLAKEAAIAVSKQDVMRIFDPLTNQDKNAWSMDYRRFHDLWSLENKVDGLYVNIKDAA